MVTLRNSQIANYNIVNHGKAHPGTPFELLWAFRRDGQTQVTWKFFRTQKAAKAFADDLTNAIVNADGSQKEMN